MSFAYIPYHKMSLSSWLVPGGNRDEKKNYTANKSFPQSSAIRRNLGGPLSEIFFTNLSPVLLDKVRFNKEISGPGKDLWVSPSDILIGKIGLKPPFTNRLNLARTHHWIMEVGETYLQKIADICAQELNEALALKEKEVREESALALQEAVERNKQQMLKKHAEQTTEITNNLKQAFDEVMRDVIYYMADECHSNFSAALAKLQESMHKELQIAVKAREKFVRHEYAFYLEWQANKCFEAYERKLKKAQKEWFKLFEEAQDKFEHDLARMKAAMESEQINLLEDLHHKLVWDCRNSKQEMQLVFKNWYMKEFKKKIELQEFAIIDHEMSLESKTKQIRNNDSKVKDLYSQFQKFINFALKEKPGQTEFLLSLELLLKEKWTDVCEGAGVSKDDLQNESELIAKSVLEHTLRNIFNQKDCEDMLFGPKHHEKPVENIKEEIELERVANRALKVIGETTSSVGSIKRFQQKRLDSLKFIFQRHPSLSQFFQEEPSQTNTSVE